MPPVILSRQTFEHIVAASSDDEVIQIIANSAPRRAEQPQLFDMVRESMIDIGLGLVIAFVLELQNRVAGVADVIDVVAEAALEEVETGLAVDDVIALAADQPIVAADAA